MDTAAGDGQTTPALVPPFSMSSRGIATFGFQFIRQGTLTVRFSLQKRSLRYAAIALHLLVAGLLARCGGGSTSSGGTALLQWVQITAVSGASAVAGTQVQLIATAIYSDFSRKDVTRTATWTSSNPTIATVSTRKVWD